MKEPNTNDPLENLLAAQPLEQVPESVYDRLQGRATWNRPWWSGPELPWILVLAVAAILVVAFFSWPLSKSAVGVPEQMAPFVMPAPSAPMVVRTVPVPVTRRRDDDFRDIGGLSTRWMTDEPPFLANFGKEVDISSCRSEFSDS